MIEDVIYSVESQKNVKLEHVIVDGYSDDGTRDFLLSLNKGHLKFISEKDKGIYEGLNKGLMLSKNEIIGILHSDDLFADSDVLNDVLCLFERGADVVYADLQYVDRKDPRKIFRNWRAGMFHPNDLLFGWMPPHPTFFFRKELLNEIGVYDLNYKIAADYDHMLRFLTRPDLNISYLPRVVTKMRVGGESNKNLKNIIRKSREDYAITTKYFSSPLGTLLFKNLRKVTQLRIF